MYAEQYWIGVDLHCRFYLPPKVLTPTVRVSCKFLPKLSEDSSVIESDESHLFRTPLRLWMSGRIFTLQKVEGSTFYDFVVDNFVPYTDGILQFRGLDENGSRTFLKYIDIEAFSGDGSDGSNSKNRSSIYDSDTDSWITDPNDPSGFLSDMDTSRAGIATGNISVKWNNDLYPSPCGIIAYDNNNAAHREVTARMTVNNKTVGYSRGHRFNEITKNGVTLRVTGLFFDKFVWLEGDPEDTRSVKFEVTLAPVGESPISIAEDVVLSPTSSAVVSPTLSDGTYTVTLRSDYT